MTLVEETKKSMRMLYQVLMTETSSAQIEETAEVLAANCTEVMELEEVPTELRKMADRVRLLASALEFQALRVAAAILEQEACGG